jgi:sugar phosphate isomerase/epimerase
MSHSIPWSRSIPCGLASREGRPDLSDLASTLDEVADLALDHVELPAYAYDLVVRGRVLPARLRDLREACRGRAHRFTVHGPLSINFMGPAAHLPSFDAAARAFVEISAAIGAPHLVLHAGMVQASEVRGIEDAYARQRAHLAKLGDIAGDHGVTVCIENVFDWSPYVATPGLARLAREIEAIGHEAIRATFDFSHGLIHATQHGYDFLAEAEALAPWAKHLHLHDSFGLPDLPWVYAVAEADATGMGDLHLPVGWGAVPWEALATRCRFPQGVIAIHELAFRFFGERGEALAGARRFAASLKTAAPAPGA